MKKLTVSVLLFFMLSLANLQGACASSETIQLISGTYIVKVFELQEGDYFEGSFDISTLYSYKSLFDNKIYTYWATVDAFDPERNVIADYPKLEDHHQYQLHITANSSGRYEISFFEVITFFLQKQ